MGYENVRTIEVGRVVINKVENGYEIVVEDAEEENEPLVFVATTVWNIYDVLKNVYREI